MRYLCLLLFLLSGFVGFGQVLTKEIPFRLRGKVKEVRTIVAYTDDNLDININNDIDKNQLITFNKAGYVTERVIYEENAPSITMKASFDKNNRITRQEMLSHKDQVTDERVFTFDEQKNTAVGKRTISSQPNQSFKVNYVFDKNNHLIELIQYDSEGNFYSKDIFVYNEKGNPVEQSLVGHVGNEDKKLFASYTAYDAQNRPIEEIIEDYDNYITSKAYYTYEGNTADPATQKYSTNGSFPFYASIKYKWDASGNWTEKNYLYNDKVIISVKREISYY